MEKLQEKQVEKNNKKLAVEEGVMDLDWRIHIKGQKDIHIICVLSSQCLDKFEKKLLPTVLVNRTYSVQSFYKTMKIVDLIL